MDQAVYETLDHVCDSIRESGGDPEKQLLAYLSSGNIRYITRHGGAREIVQRIQRSDLLVFVSRFDH